VYTVIDQVACRPREWLHKRSCALTPRQLGLSYLMLCGLSFAVASIWLWRGAWVVLDFSVLEMTAAALAWFIYARHATDHECPTLADGWLQVDLVEAGRVRSVRLDPRQTRIIAPAGYGALIRLEASGAKVEVGRYVCPGRWPMNCGTCCAPPDAGCLVPAACRK
jgi:uncharacterized membrane protein